MFILIFLLSQFCNQYKAFVNSPASDSIFNSLTRGDYKITQFSDNPVILWFWHTNSDDPRVDTLLKKVPVRRNFYLAGVLRWEAKKTEGYDNILSKLNLALHFDSLSIENFVSLLSLGFRYRRFEPIVKAFSLSVFKDFRSQIFSITNFVIYLFLVVMMTATIYIIVKTIYYFPVLSHRLDPQSHNRTKGLVGFMLLLAPLLILRQPYLALLCYATLLVFVLATRERNWLRFLFILLLIIFVFTLPINNLIKFLSNKCRTYQLYKFTQFDTALNLKPENEIEKVLLAYGLKQQGKLEEAMSLYEDLYYGRERTLAVVNNLANIYFLYDDLPRAEELYKSITYNQPRGEPYFNMGLLKLKTIEYSASSRYMEEARKRNFSRLIKEPADISPSNREFYNLLFAEKLKLSGIINFYYLIPLLLILILSFIPIRMEPPYYCTTCGRPLCKECHKVVEDEVLCQDCFTKFKSTKSAEVEVSLRESVGRGKRRTKRFLTYLVNLVIPGSGLLYINKNFIGLILVTFTMFGYVPLLFSHYFIKPSGWVALPARPIFILTAVVIAIISYIVSFLIIRESYAD